MIKVIGDIHGETEKVFYEIAKSAAENNGESIHLILLGDAGINFYLNREDERAKCGLQNYINFYRKERGIDIKILFVRGNHDCPPKHIFTYRETAFCGGTVYVEDNYPGLLFLKDGEMYKIENKTFYVIGGGNSTDYFSRLLNNQPYFSDESLSYEEQDIILQSLSEMKEDNIILLSHMLPEWTSPERKKRQLAGSSMEGFLQKVYTLYHEKISLWLAGHYHRDMSFEKDNTCFKILFNKVLII